MDNYLISGVLIRLFAQTNGDLGDIKLLWSGENIELYGFFFLNRKLSDGFATVWPSDV